MLKVGFCFYLKSLPFSWHSLMHQFICSTTFHLHMKGEGGGRMVADMLREKKKKPLGNIGIRFSILPSGKGRTKMDT